jgi:isopenicillin-N N-acyltransferase like protein
MQPPGLVARARQQASEQGATLTTSITPVIRVEGSGRQRGESHGEEARDLVRESASRWAESVGLEVSLPVERYLDELVERSGFVRTAQRLTPDLVEEVDGIAAGSGVDRRRVMALNLMDEDWWLRTRFGSSPLREHCSSFGASLAPGQPAILGQNMDLRGLDGLQLLLDVLPDSGPRLLAPTCAGMIATNGFNEHGIGICVNTLRQLPSSIDGLPVAFVIRAIAAMSSYADAVGLLRRLPHASGQSYIVGSPNAVGCFECSAASAVEYRPGARIAHTNHPLAAPAVPAVVPENFSNTLVRLAHLERRVDAAARIDIGWARTLLAEAPLCRGGAGDDGGFTFYSVIMEPAAGRLWLTDGPPDRHTFRRYDLPNRALAATAARTQIAS